MDDIIVRMWLINSVDIINDIKEVFKQTLLTSYKIVTIPTVDELKRGVMNKNNNNLYLSNGLKMGKCTTHDINVLTVFNEMWFYSQGMVVTYRSDDGQEICFRIKKSDYKQYYTSEKASMNRPIISYYERDKMVLQLV